jgi:hypothetical protein
MLLADQCLGLVQKSQHRFGYVLHGSNEVMMVPLTKTAAAWSSVAVIFAATVSLGSIDRTSIRKLLTLL